MRTMLVVLMALCLIAGTVMAEKPKPTEEPILIHVGNGIREGGEDIGSAAPIGPLPYYDSGDTSDNLNDYSYGSSDGPDVVYSFTPTTDFFLNVSLCGSAFDTYLIIATADLTVIDYNDDGTCATRALQSELFDVPLTGGVEYFIVVTGYGSSAGVYELNVSEGTTPPVVTFCDMVTDETGTFFTGNTCGGVNLVDYDAVCEIGSSYGHGSEHYYSGVLPEGCIMTANVVFPLEDAVLWLLRECEALGGAFECIQRADSGYTGDPEEIVYENTSGADERIYIVIEDYYTDGCGDYELSVTSTCGPIANETMTFGGVKSLYR